MRWCCRHDWSKWETIKEFRDGEIVQRRACAKCGKEKRRLEDPQW